MLLLMYGYECGSLKKEQITDKTEMRFLKAVLGHRMTKHKRNEHTVLENNLE
jgi:hypothetical protein